MILILNWDDPVWNEFVRHSEYSTIFHTFEWSRILLDTYHNPVKVLAVGSSPSRITAGLPFVEVTDLLGRRAWITLPFSDHCTPLAETKPSMKQLIDGIETRLVQSSGLSAEIRWDITPTDRFISFTGQVLHKLDLSAGFTQVSSKIHSMHHRNTEKAKKKGLTPKVSTDLQGMREFYRLHTFTRHKKGIPVQPWNFFQNIFTHLIKTGMGHVLSIYSDNRCIASAVFLYWGKTLTYKFGASDPDFLIDRPNNLLFWEAIQWGCDNHYQQLDLGRTDVQNTSLREFKSRWGADETPLPYCYYPHIPHGIPQWMQQLGSRVITVSPAWVCRAVGEVAYRALV